MAEGIPPKGVSKGGGSMGHENDHFQTVEDLHARQGRRNTVWRAPPAPSSTAQATVGSSWAGSEASFGGERRGRAAVIINHLLT